MSWVFKFAAAKSVAALWLELSIDYIYFGVFREKWSLNRDPNQNLEHASAIGLLIKAQWEAERTQDFASV